MPRGRPRGPTMPESEKRKRLDVRLSPVSLEQIKQGLALLAQPNMTRTAFIEAAIAHYVDAIKASQAGRPPLIELSPPSSTLAVYDQLLPLSEEQDAQRARQEMRRLNRPGEVIRDKDDDELAQVPEWYRDDQDHRARSFKAWLRVQYPPLIHRQKRRVANPLRELATRLIADELIPEQATKNHYLILLYRYGYSEEDMRLLHNLWVEFLREPTTLPDDGLVQLQAFADLHHVSRNEAERSWKAGCIAVHKRGEGKLRRILLDEKGRRDFWVQFHQTSGFLACDRCPHS